MTLGLGIYFQSLEMFDALQPARVLLMSLSSTEEAPKFDWELSVQAITVRIRWFGIVVGYCLVNLIGGGETSNRKRTQCDPCGGSDVRVV